MKSLWHHFVASPFGIIVFPFYLLFHLPKVRFASCVMEKGEEVGGKYEWTHNRITVSSKRPFAIFHELAHWVFFCWGGPDHWGHDWIDNNNLLKWP